LSFSFYYQDSILGLFTNKVPLRLPYHDRMEKRNYHQLFKTQFAPYRRYSRLPVGR